MAVRTLRDDLETQHVERRDHDGTGHEAPETGNYGRQHHQLKAAFALAGADRVADDDERSRKGEKRHGSECRWSRTSLQQAKTCRTFGRKLVAGRQRAGERKADRKRKEGLNLLRRHLSAIRKTRANRWQSGAGAATTSLI